MEDYSGNHAESVEELLQWPWLRFEKFYDAFQKRKIVEELTQRKISMINALYSNSNYDGKENAQKREDLIGKLEEQYSDVILKLYNGYDREKEDAEKMKRNPFFQAMERGLDRQGVPSAEEMDETERTLPDDSDEEFEIDQK